MANDTEIALVDEIEIPAKNRRDMKAACDLQFELRGKDLERLRVDLTEVRGGRVLDQIEGDIRDARRGTYRTVLFSGHVGSGETTEAPLADEAVGDGEGGATAKKLWRGMRDWLKPIGIELEAEIPKGVAKLKAKVKTEFDLQKRMRETLRERVTELMTDLSDLLIDLRTGLAKQGVDDLVIVADNLEKIVLSELDHQGAT